MNELAKKNRSSNSNTSHLESFRVYFRWILSESLELLVGLSRPALGAPSPCGPLCQLSQSVAGGKRLLVELTFAPVATTDTAPRVADSLPVTLVACGRRGAIAKPTRSHRRRQQHLSIAARPMEQFHNGTSASCYCCCCNQEATN